jgi:hypothetical protein
MALRQDLRRWWFRVYRRTAKGFTTEEFEFEAQGGLELAKLDLLDMCEGGLSCIIDWSSTRA